MQYTSRSGRPCWPCQRHADDLLPDDAAGRGRHVLFGLPVAVRQLFPDVRRLAAGQHDAAGVAVRPGERPGHPKNPFTLAIFKVLHVVVPNFGNYNIQNPIINPHEHIDATSRSTSPGTSSMPCVYTAILLMVGTLIFDRREV